MANLFWCTYLSAWVRVIEQRTLFGRDIARVTTEGGSTVHTVPTESLQTSRPFDVSAALATVAGARIWSALGSDLLLAPLVSNVMPLPHQFRALRKAMETFPVRIMLADEVGMGKTIEAGLVLKELKLRGMIERILVIAPKSLLIQWVLEMDSLFNEQFHLVRPGDWGADVSVRGENAWKRYSQVVTSLDSVKEMVNRRGWTQEKIDQYNQTRFHDLMAAGWDLVIIDECHKVAGASDEVSRHMLAGILSDTVPHLMLLTATPHSGKSDAFIRLLSLIDYSGFKEDTILTRELIDNIVIRTEKRTATDADGKLLFAPRTTQLVIIPLTEKHQLQKQLYEEVSRYAAITFSQSNLMADSSLRFLITLFQRLVSSSTRALRRFLEKRIAAIATLHNARKVENEELLFDDPEADEQNEPALLAVSNNISLRSEEDNLLDLAKRVEAFGPDARAEALYAQIMQIAHEEGDPSVKILIFTEFYMTQEMLNEYLNSRGFTVALLNGSMEIPERISALNSFRNDAQILISTEAGGEGLNMQFAHVIINYDLPWNPMRVEQRIGRVDRIGQTKQVRAINLALENSIEARLYEIWNLKLGIILEEFGVDKTGDVLDSSKTNTEFEKLARTALMNPDALVTEFDKMATEIRREAAQAEQKHKLYEGTIADADMQPHVPIHAWIETMRSASPTGIKGEADNTDLSTLLIERINSLAPYFAQGTPVPSLHLTGLGFPLNGWFSIWKVGLAEGIWRQQAVFPCFLSSEGKSYSKSAQRLWDELATRQITIDVTEETMGYDFTHLQQQAEQEAADLYETIVSKTHMRAKQRLKALETSYVERVKVLELLKLEAIRTSRRQDLDEEYSRKMAEINLMSEALPDLSCLFLCKVDAE